MDLKLDEQLLIAEFRRLNPGEKKELLDYAAFLAKKSRSNPSDESTNPVNQCRVGDKPEERPEAAKEPIFTE